MAGGQNDLELTFSANLDNLKKGMVEAQSSVSTLATSLKGSLIQVNSSTAGAGAGTASLEEKFKRLKGELSSGDRAINFFARSLNAFVPEASAAGKALRLLGDGIVGGLGAGFAIQAAMTGLELVGEKWKEIANAEKEATERGKEYLKALNDGVPQALERLKELRTDRLKAMAGDDKVAAFDYDTDAKRKELLEAARKAREALAAGPDMSKLGPGQYAPALAALRRNALIAQNELTSFEAQRAEARIKVVADAVKAAKELADAASNAARAADKAWADNTENAIQPIGYESPGTTVPFVRSKEVSEWMPRSSMGGIGADLDRITADWNAKSQRSWKADDKMLAQANKAGEEIGKAFAQPIVSSLEDAFAQMITGQKSFNDSMKDLWRSLAGSLAKTAIGMAFSFIPGIGGPLGAAVSGAIPSAAGGWSVPKGWNGLAMIHEEEVVLDRQTKRALMGGAGGNVSVSISAVDAPSLVALMQNNPEAILGPIREARRDRRF